MTNESSDRPCPACGAPLPSEADSHGLCPRCVLAQALHPTEPTAASSHQRLPPPSLDELRSAFPQLEIVEWIGSGGMGHVYKARQPRLDRWVALKVLPVDPQASPAFAARFDREARVLARLNHPNIVTLFDFGQVGNLFFLLMEYVDGVNLRQAMRAGRFSPAEALNIVPAICSALQFAHLEGILHRDIKPENILLDGRGRVKIVDFGIAKMVDENSPGPTLTASGSALGTPHYMAPEQIERPSEVDHRADIYSLGVVFYEMLTGELPLGRFAPPSEKTPMDSRVDAIVLRALAKERELRQQSASELRTAVETVSAAPASPSASRAADATSTGKCLCYLSSPRQLTGCLGRWWYPFESRGAIKLNAQGLEFQSESEGHEISFSQIAELGIGQYPLGTTLTRLTFLAVTWLQNGERRTVLLTPVPSGSPTLDQINEHVLSWKRSIEIQLRTSGLRMPEEFFPTWSHQRLNGRQLIPIVVPSIIIGVGVLMAVAAARRGNSAAPFGPAIGGMTGMMTFYYLSTQRLRSALNRGEELDRAVMRWGARKPREPRKPSQDGRLRWGAGGAFLTLGTFAISGLALASTGSWVNKPAAILSALVLPGLALITGNDRLRQLALPILRLAAATAMIELIWRRVFPPSPEVLFPNQIASQSVGLMIGIGLAFAAAAALRWERWRALSGVTAEAAPPQSSWRFQLGAGAAFLAFLWLAADHREMVPMAPQLGMDQINPHWNPNLITAPKPDPTTIDFNVDGSTGLPLSVPPKGDAGTLSGATDSQTAMSSGIPTLGNQDALSPGAIPLATNQWPARRVLELRLRQERMELDQVQKQAAVGVVAPEGLEMLNARSAVALIEAQLTGDLAQVFQVQLNHAEAKLKLYEAMASVGRVSSVEVEQARTQRDVAARFLQAARAPSTQPATQ